MFHMKLFEVPSFKLIYVLFSVGLQIYFYFQHWHSLIKLQSQSFTCKHQTFTRRAAFAPALTFQIHDDKGGCLLSSVSDCWGI